LVKSITFKLSGHAYGMEKTRNMYKISVGKSQADTGIFRHKHHDNIIMNLGEIWCDNVG
jgi:hypothetical protein